MFSRVTCDGINKSCLKHIGDHLSCHACIKKQDTSLVVPDCPTNPEKWCPSQPPTGDEIRDLLVASQCSNHTMSGICDNERCHREIQSVGTNLAAAQNHTADAAKNCQKKPGGRHIWDCIVETGEAASAVLVPAAKADDIAHAAEGLARRNHFDPEVLFCDTWPHNKNFWGILFKAQGTHHQSENVSENISEWN